VTNDISQPESDRFYAGALDRIRILMIVLGGALSLAAWLIFGMRPALGFLLGCVIAYLNFQ
jgi:uncharacterized RDD family membrane protein YckC